jgi:hypothetical protein
MRILDLIHDRHILQLDIQELVHAFEGTADGDVIFELDGDLCVDEGFEEAESERRSVIIHRIWWEVLCMEHVQTVAVSREDNEVCIPEEEHLETRGEVKRVTT